MQERLATVADAAAIAAIYNQGIEDRIATFETELRTEAMVASWFDGRHPIVVVEQDGELIAYASTSAYRSRPCYAGIAEFSVYVQRDWRGKGAGRVAMAELIQESARAGLWKLVSRVFVENAASRGLLRSVGFREVGIYEKHAQLDGVWHDVVIVERLLPTNLTSKAQETTQVDDIVPAQAADLPTIRALLAHAGLPQEGLAETLSTILIAREAGQVIGCVALEIYGKTALLRSVAVHAQHRSQALGSQLVQRELQEAKRRGIQEVYLLTETARDYFPRFGFRPIAREAVAPAIHQSIEWTSACPVSAQPMVIQIEAEETE